MVISSAMDYNSTQLNMKINSNNAGRRGRSVDNYQYSREWKMYGISSPKTVVTTYQIAWHHNSEARNLMYEH
jgi:hypothetical protein